MSDQQHLVFATANPHKLEEIRAMLPNHRVLGLHDVGVTEEIAETGSTLEENAFIKAKYLFDKMGVPCFSEDTGLEVDILNGDPGVYTARYGGDEKDAHKNMDKLLRVLDGHHQRDAQFRTIIAYVDHRQTLYFEGLVRGRIATFKSKNVGFGYDPIFIPDGYDLCFADLSLDIKNKISHRAKAVEKMIYYFQHEFGK